VKCCDVTGWALKSGEEVNTGISWIVDGQMVVCPTCRAYFWTNKVLDEYFYGGPDFLHNHVLEMTSSSSLKGHFLLFDRPYKENKTSPWWLLSNTCVGETMLVGITLQC